MFDSNALEASLLYIILPKIKIQSGDLALLFLKEGVVPPLLSLMYIIPILTRSNLFSTFPDTLKMGEIG